MDDKLPVIYLTIDENDEAGVDAIALVDNPAIERQWMAFAKNKAHKFEITNEEKRVISGPLMISDFPIFRIDDNGKEYYVVFNADTIRKIVYKYMKEGRTNSVNEMHETALDGVFMFESFIIDDRKKTPKGYEELPEGSWFGSFRVENDDVWQQVKEGDFKGFSVEGLFSEDKEIKVERDIIEAIVSGLKG
tara:strand:- start:589 stop:1161 length:573 start_codon:yes stop_codon:yes gene_type:complete